MGDSHTANAIHRRCFARFGTPINFFFLLYFFLFFESFVTFAWWLYADVKNVSMNLSTRSKIKLKP